MGKDQKDLPLPDPELEKPDPELPKPEKDLPLPDKEIPAKNTDGIKSGFPIYKSFIFGFIFILVISLLGVIFFIYQNQNKSIDKNEISSYEECVEAGYPIQESYPEKCTVPGAASFTRELTEDEKEKLNPGIYEGDEYSFEYPTETFSLAHLVCKNNPPGPMLIDKSENKISSGVGCVLGIVFDINVVDEIEDFDAACYSVNKEQIEVGGNPATSYTAEFIGGDIDKCTEGMTGMISDTHRYIYVEHENQTYLIQWPVQDYIDQTAYDQILSTFKFTDAETTVDTSSWKTYTNNKHGYSIKHPPNPEIMGQIDRMNGGIAEIDGQEDIIDFIPDKNGDHKQFLQIQVYDVNESFKEGYLKTITQQYEGNKKTASRISDLESFQFKGASDGYMFDFKTDFIDTIQWRGIVEDGEYISYYIIKNNKLYSINLRDSATFNEMFSTFQFTE